MTLADQGLTLFHRQHPTILRESFEATRMIAECLLATNYLPRLKRPLRGSFSLKGCSDRDGSRLPSWDRAPRRSEHRPTGRGHPCTPDGSLRRGSATGSRPRGLTTGDRPRPLWIAALTRPDLMGGCEGGPPLAVALVSKPPCPPGAGTLCRRWRGSHVARGRFSWPTGPQGLGRLTSPCWERWKRSPSTPYTLLALFRDATSAGLGSRPGTTQA